MKPLFAIAAVALLHGLHAQPAILTSELPWAAAGAPYSVSIETLADPRCMEGGGVTLSVVEGELPHGFDLRGSGIQGVAMEIGTYDFVLRAATVCGATARRLSLVVNGRPILRATPDKLVFDYRSGAADPPEQTILVSGTWPAMPYSVSARNRAEWLRCTPSSGATPPGGSALSADSVAIRVHPGGKPPGIYEEQVRVAAWGGANAPVVTVILNVK